MDQSYMDAASVLYKMSTNHNNDRHHCQQRCAVLFCSSQGGRLPRNTTRHSFGILLLLFVLSLLSCFTLRLSILLSNFMPLLSPDTVSPKHPETLEGVAESNSSHKPRIIPTQPFQSTTTIASHSNSNNTTNNQTGGFIILGMHRSGTSMLAGLLINGSGYHAGNTFEGSPENEKGYFELAPAVFQNNVFMAAQAISWDTNVTHYKDEYALHAIQQGTVPFGLGRQALRFLNHPRHRPWILKDPRMCITLQTWLPLLHITPAIVFTYRNPWEVASSLQVRSPDWSLVQGLQLWMAYNMRAIHNSQGLCRVFTSKDLIIEDPFGEAQRIVHDLTHTCHVPPPPRTMTQAIANELVDPRLQHNTMRNEGNHTTVLAMYKGCPIPNYRSDYAEPDSAHAVHERNVYMQAMQMYCDFESGAAYADTYVWPTLSTVIVQP
jgi:hypothetical protein